MSNYTEALSKYNLELNDAEIAAKVKQILTEKVPENDTEDVKKFLFGSIELTTLKTTDSETSVMAFTQKVNDFDNTYPDLPHVAKIHVPIVHIEAGLRSFNKSMPEEINRIVCDHCSTLLFSPTLAGYENLKHEGFPMNNAGPYTIDNPKVYHCGDIMYDNSLYFSTLSAEKTDIIQRLGLSGKPFVLSTIHRDSNTDQPQRLTAIFESIIEVSKEVTVVLPLHPRTAKLLKTNLSAENQERLFNSENIKLIPPVSFLEMIELERNAMLIMTDSGGVQKESYFFKKPCIILRPETEWVEIVKTGSAVLADADKQRILESWKQFKTTPPTDFPEIFGNGKAAEFMLEEMWKTHANR